MEFYLFGLAELHKGYFIFPCQLFDIDDSAKSLGFYPVVYCPLTGDRIRGFCTGNLYKTVEEAIAVAKCEVEAHVYFYHLTHDEQSIKNLESLRELNKREANK